MVRKYEADDYPDHGHNIFADQTDRFELDQILRQYGFKIHSRAAGKDAEWTWTGDGAVYPQPAAVAMTGDRRASSLQRQLESRRRRLHEQRQRDAG